MQSDELDQVHDLRLRSAQQQAPLPTPQAVREHRQVDHQGRVGEDKISQVDEHVTLSAKREDKRASAEALCTPILVSGAKQHRRVVGELDDPGNLQNGPAATQA